MTVTLPRPFRCLAAVVAAALLAGCAGGLVGGAPGPAVAAPPWRVGDRWTYRGTEGFRSPIVWEEVHEIVAVGADGIDVRVTQKGNGVDTARVERWRAPGLLERGAVFDSETKAYAPPVQFYAYPLEVGKHWNQFVRSTDPATGRSGEINRYVDVGGYSKVDTPAGSFDAIALRVFTTLDDEEFWRGPTRCTYLIFYAPAAGAMVREIKEAEYWEKGDRRDGVGAIRAQHAVVELVKVERAR